MKDKISESKAGETSLKESRERISRFLRRVEYEFSKRSPSEEKSIDWLTFGYFISFYSHSFEEQTNYLGNIREFTFFFLFFFFWTVIKYRGKSWTGFLSGLIDFAKCCTIKRWNEDKYLEVFLTKKSLWKLKRNRWKKLNSW